ncbi:MAG: hypothetical protein H6612_06850 [Ignavibacteriales bacterium]|nr:hypothetical protein [Ignavibacteriales bacterium]
MKRRILNIFITLLLINLNIGGQVKLFEPEKTCWVNIITNDKDTLVGNLFSVEEEKIKINKSLNSNFNQIDSLHYSNIFSVTIIKESQVSSSMGNGFLIGAGIGLLLGLASGDDEGSFIRFSAGQKALMGGVAFGLAGALMGSAVGVGLSENEEIIIRNKNDLFYLKNFISNKNELNKSLEKRNEEKQIENKPTKHNEDIKEPEISFNKKIEIAFYLGTTSSGPAQNIENQLIKSGFDETTYNWFSSRSITHPISYTGFGELGAPWFFSLKYFYSKEYAFGGIYGNNPIGSTHGYNNQFGYIFLNYSIKTLAPMIWFKYGVLNLGGGPAYFFTKTWEDNSKNISNTSTVGVVFDLGITFPPYSSMFVAVNAQLRYMGKVNIGQFEISDGENVLVIPETKVNFSHTAFSLGTGFRF